MSFILDALKKSESDRQRQSGPSLFEVKVAPPRRTLPIWAIAIAVLLGINAIVVSWMLLRRGPVQQRAIPAAVPAPAKVATTAAPVATAEAAPAAVPADSAAESSTSAAASGPAVALRHSPPERGAAPGAAIGGTSTGGAALTGQTAAAAASAAGSTDQSAAQPPSGANPSDYAPAVEPTPAPSAGAPEGGAEDLPLYQQIVTSSGLPALHLDLHVYAPRPKDRFVMINMERLREGDSLPNGTRVEAIRPDGVVLSYHGTQFLLPRN